METTVPFIDCVAEVAGKAVAMRGSTYVYLDTKESVAPSVLTEAKALQATKEKELLNLEVLKQIAAKEAELIRPMREVLATTTSAASKDFAQNKIDTLESEIQSLREQLV